MFVAYIYRIKSIIHPDRCYIGSTDDFACRIRKHKMLLRQNTHSNPILQNHCNKYGFSDLLFDMLYIFEATNMNDMFETEQYFIDSYKPYFNILKAGEMPRGFVKGEKSWNSGEKNCYSDETRRRISESNKNFYLTEEGLRRREYMREFMKGKKMNEGHKHSDETRKKLSENLLGRKHSQEFKDKLSEIFRGKFFKRMYSDDGKRLCSSCGEHLDLSCFSKNIKVFDGLGRICRECAKKYVQLRKNRG